MRGLMQDWPLLRSRMIDHGASIHGDREVVTRSVEGPIHRTNYRNIRARALKVAQRLEHDGIKLGDRVATLGWNTWRHLESWYGIMGIGAICHTVNPRLFPEQVAWIINHAEDRIVMIDLTFVPLFHANSWGIAFSAPSMGTKLVLPGPKLDGASVFELLDTEKVTYTAGVPTVWLMLLQYMEANKVKLPCLKTVVCGGSAMPRS